MQYFKIGGTSSSSTKGVSPGLLYKICRIDPKEAGRTIDVTRQHLRRTNDPKLSRNYSANDRMLRYRRTNQHFFLDTLFAMNKYSKSKRGYICMQIFVTDKGFV